MPYRQFSDQNCSIARALEVVGERWTLLVLREVMLGRRRFQDMKRNTGIASNILTDRLETLVAHGVLVRDGAEYKATQKGLDLNPVLVSLMQWGDRYDAPAGPPKVIVHTTCGHDAAPELHCSHCHEPIDTRELRVRSGPGAESVPA